MSDHSRPGCVCVCAVCPLVIRLITATCPTELSLTTLLTSPCTVTLLDSKSPDVSPWSTVKGWWIKPQLWDKNHRHRIAHETLWEKIMYQFPCENRGTNQPKLKWCCPDCLGTPLRMYPTSLGNVFGESLSESWGLIPQNSRDPGP